MMTQNPKCHSLVSLISKPECISAFDFPFNQNVIYTISCSHPPLEVTDIVKVSRHGPLCETIIPCSFLYMDSLSIIMDLSHVIQPQIAETQDNGYRSCLTMENIKTVRSG